MYNLYEDQFSQEHDLPITNKPSKVLIIASTGRSGSHMLGHALHNTNKFGFPLEYANPANLKQWKKQLNIENFQDVMTEIQKRRTSHNGVFGIKIHYSHIKQFGSFANLNRMFPDAYYILLSREDVLSQAVSLSIAQQTGVWISGQEPSSEIDPVYNFDNINKNLRDTIIDNASWRYTLAACGCNYIEMNFDEVRHNLNKSILRISNFLDIELDSHEIPLELVTKKQSNKLNKEWKLKFISEFNKFEQLIPNKIEHNIMSNVKEKIKRKIKKILKAEFKS